MRCREWTTWGHRLLRQASWCTCLVLRTLWTCWAMFLFLGNFRTWASQWSVSKWPMLSEYLDLVRKLRQSVGMSPRSQSMGTRNRRLRLYINTTGNLQPAPSKVFESMITKITVPDTNVIPLARPICIISVQSSLSVRMPSLQEQKLCREPPASEPFPLSQINQVANIA